MAKRNIITKRIHGDSSNYVGKKGELFYNVDESNQFDLRFSDGSTVGGVPAFAGGTQDLTQDVADLEQEVATITQDVGRATSGYEFTGGFTNRTSGQAGVSDLGSDVDYNSTMVANKEWFRFGFDDAQQITNDSPYWGDSTDATEAPHSGTTDYQGVGLFSGAYMPPGVTSMFQFGETTEYSNAKTDGDLKYNAATGSYDMSNLNVGDFCSFRFDFNITTRFVGTTVEVGLIWATRDANDDVTFTFALTGEPIFFGAGTPGKTYLNRPIITAYLASLEDVNARALPAIRADQPVFVQPLTTLFVATR